MKKKIAIIGTTSSLVDAPYNDPEWEIWGLNGAYQCIPRWDRWFDMHSLKVLKKYHEPVYFEFLKAAGSKAILAHKMGNLPDAKLFPSKKLVNKYGRYFTNTISWLIAYAMEQNPETIGIWGVNMAMDTEYAAQRPSCEYFLGLAKGKGIEIVIPDTSEMLKCSYLYGIEPVPAYIAKFPDKKRELTNNYNETMAEIDNGQGTMNFINGYVTGSNEFADFIRAEYPHLDNVVGSYLHEKHSKFKNDAMMIEKELKELLHKKSYLNGALDLQSYNEKNWSH